LKPRFVHIAAVGAPCSLTRDRYFGSQPSTEAWYSVRAEPDIVVTATKA
jgi:hypothetical protein